jgi:hypothetical protein
MPPAAVARRPQCRSSTPVGRRATRDGYAADPPTIEEIVTVMRGAGSREALRLVRSRNSLQSAATHISGSSARRVDDSRLRGHDPPFWRTEPELFRSSRLSRGEWQDSAAVGGRLRPRPRRPLGGVSFTVALRLEILDWTAADAPANPPPGDAVRPPAGDRVGTTLCRAAELSY